MKKVLALLMMVSPLAFGDMMLDEKVSALNFISIKKDSVAEVQRFTGLTGVLTDSGDLTITIDLNSVDTRIDIRDSRMKEFLFQTDLFPTASYTAKLDTKGLKKMIVGEIQRRQVKGTLSLHGVEAPLDILVRIVKVPGGALVVSTIEPALVKTDDFGLAEGVNKLMELANLPSITRVVPVTFDVIFR